MYIIFQIWYGLSRFCLAYYVVHAVFKASSMYHDISHFGYNCGGLIWRCNSLIRKLMSESDDLQYLINR